MSGIVDSSLYDAETDREEAEKMRREWFGLIIGVPTIFMLVTLGAFGCAVVFVM